MEEKEKVDQLEEIQENPSETKEAYENKEHKKEKKEKHKKEHESLRKELEELKKENETLKQTNGELLNKMQYTQAEMINYRKRSEKETENRLKFANQDLIMEIIPILDNFERAIKLDDNNLTDELSKFLAGFKMMYANLDEVLKKYGVEEIPCVGKPFNPNEMQALMVDHDANFQDDEVIEVLLKGYKLKDRVIRPASVKVNKLEENKGEDKDE